MPNIKSAQKALRQNKRRRPRNLKKQDVYKKAVKDVRKFAGAGKPQETQEALTRAYKSLDKAAKGNVITKNKASRLKSRLAHATAKSKSASS